MDFSLPFRRDSTLSGNGEPSPKGESKTQSDDLVGEFIGIAIKSRIKRSFLGHSQRMKPLGEGTSFRTFRSSIREYDEDRNVIATPVAIKMLRGNPHGTASSLYPNKHGFQKKQLEALLREMHVLCNPSLRGHDNIVKLLEWGFSTVGSRMEDIEDPAWVVYQPYLLLEFAEHGTLRAFCHTETCPSVTRDLALDLASGLEALHACGIIHGDLKLDNVLVYQHPERGYCGKLSDFTHSINPATASNYEYLGTECYRPPELSQHGPKQPLPLDSLLKCDIWCFGVAIFELLSTSNFPGNVQDEEAPVHVLDSHIQLALSRASEQETAMWRDVLTSSLCVNAADRKSIKELRAALDVKHRCQPASFGHQAPFKFPTVLEIMARYSVCDEKYHLQHRLVQTSVCGPKSQRSYNYFQLAQAHYIGFGFEPDIGRAHLSCIFSAKEEDEPSDPQALSLCARILGTHIQGHGPFAEAVSQATAILSEVSDEAYYATRVRTYRSLSVRSLQSVLLTTATNSDLSFEKLAALIESHQIPSAVSVKSDLLDLELQPEIPSAHFLCLVGDLDLIKASRVTEHGALQLQACDGIGNSALQYACMGGHADVVRYLVEEVGLARNSVNHQGSTPLHWLPFFGPDDIPQMAKLLSHPDSLTAISEGCRIPLHLLYLRGTPLQWSVSCRNRDAVVALLDLGADVNIEYDGYTALALAVEMHAFEMAALLLESGSKTRGLGPHGRSALHFIAGNAPMIRRQCIHGGKEIATACMKTIQILERYGCDINARDQHDNTPLLKAFASPFERGDLYVIKALLLCGADRNAQNIDGDSALHLVVKLAWADKPASTGLLKVLADDELALSDDPLKTTLRDKDGRTPHLVAAFLRVTSDIVKIIPMSREDVLAHDNDGNYFLALANMDMTGPFNHTQRFSKRLEELGLAVTPQPECT